MKWILFDLNGVIIHTTSHNFDDWLLKKGLDPKKVYEIYNKLAYKLHKGEISPKEVMKKINFKLNTKISHKEFFKERFNYKFALNKVLMKKIKKLQSQGVKVALLSDISRPSWNFVKNRSFMKEFDDLIVSCNTGFRKEESKYYNYLAKRLKCNKKDMLLVDDSIGPIKVAKKSGLKVIHYFSDKNLKRLR